MADKILVNPIECEGHGACAELLPEAIVMDEWGFPIVDSRPLPPGLERHARAAVSACPALALRLVRALAEYLNFHISLARVSCQRPGTT